MSAEEIEERQIDSPTLADRRWNRRRLIGWVVFVSLAGFFIFRTVQHARSSRTSQRETKQLKETRDQLQSLLTQLQAERDHAEQDKKVTWNLLRLCRTADDIPDYQGDLILSAGIEMDTLSMYVPDGSHTLEIACSWKQQPATNPPQPKVDLSKRVGEARWSVPLIPASGYWITIESDREGNPVQVKLTGNHPDFKPVIKTVPLEGFKQRGASYRGSDVALFPNQITDGLIAAVDHPTASPAGVKLMDLTLHGQISDQLHELQFDVRLVSDQPTCVTASDALTIIITQRQHRLMPYQGGGKYMIAPVGANVETDPN